MKCCVKPPCEITRLAEVEENVTRRRSRESQSAVLPPIGSRGSSSPMWRVRRNRASTRGATRICMHTANMPSPPAALVGGVFRAGGFFLEKAGAQIQAV